MWYLEVTNKPEAAERGVDHSEKFVTFNELMLFYEEVTT